ALNGDTSQSYCPEWAVRPPAQCPTAALPQTAFQHTATSRTILAARPILQNANDRWNKQPRTLLWALTPMSGIHATRIDVGDRSSYWQPRYRLREEHRCEPT